MVIQGHIRPILCQNHSSTFIYGPILIEICMNANILKTQFFMKFYKSLDFQYRKLQLVFDRADYNFYYKKLSFFRFHNAGNQQSLQNI